MPKTFRRAFYLCVMLSFALLFAACDDSESPLVNPADGDEEEVVAADGDEEALSDGDFELSEESDDGEDGESEEVTLSRLRAEGTKIVNADGEEVLLHGFNLGGWTYHETWLTMVGYSIPARAYELGERLGIKEDVVSAMEEIGPARVAGMIVVLNYGEWLDAFEAALIERIGEEATQSFMADYNETMPSIYDDSDLPLFKLLEQRFGIEKRDELIDTFMQAWVTEDDIRFLAEEGFNLVRVPIGYRTLTAISHLSQPTELVWNELAFDRLNDLLDWCERYGIYAVIDIQECPGGQNDYSGDALLYESETYQAMTIQLWEELSERFKERDSVAAYSLLAEPMGAPSNEARDEMYDKLYEAIRAKDDNHMLVIHDGFFGMNSLPDPADYGWENVVYSTHLFEWEATSEQSYQFRIDAYDGIYQEAQARQNVPYFIGSFSTIHDEDFAYKGLDLMLNWMGERGYSWSLWTLKRIDDPIEKEVWGLQSVWGLLGDLQSEFSRPDVYLDDEATLQSKFEAYRNLDLQPNEPLLQKLKKAASGERVGD